MKVEVENITFNFKKTGSDLLPDEENLGISYLFIPGTMLLRFKNEFYGIPHYDEEEEKDAKDQSIHQCYNTDTQIVLMSYLFDKKRKYKLDYHGMDPFWICHDHFHAKNDVYGGEVNGINSYTEKQRLLQGAEYAKEKGIYISVDTVMKLDRMWRGRWQIFEGDRMEKLRGWEFAPYMKKKEKEILEMYL